MDGDTACVGGFETEEIGEGFGDVFFDQGEGGGGIVDVDVGVEGREEEFGGHAGGVGRGVEFAHEAAVPGVDGVLEDLLDGFEEVGAGEAGGREAEVHELGEFVREVAFDEDGAGTSAGDGEAVGGFGFGGGV